MYNMKAEKFSAYLTDKLEASSVYLPLSVDAEADLIALLAADDDYIFLSISDDVSYEVVRCRNTNGTLLIERGLENTEAVTHGVGACVSSVSPLIVSVIKDLVCGYSCCEESDCVCDPVAFAMELLPKATQGEQWEGAVVFSGSLPMTIGVNGAPAWMNVESSANSIRLYGTPDATGEISFSVAATNCNGTQLTVRTVTITVGSN